MSDDPKGRFVWYDLMTTDPDAAQTFYSAVVGWGTDQWQGPNEGLPPYTMWMVGEHSIGGVMELSPEAIEQGAPPHWISYIAVPDADAAVARAQELGGTVLMPAFDIPTVGRFAVVADPSGAVFAPFKPEGEAPGSEGMAPVGQFSWNELMTDDHEAAFSFYADLFGWEKGEAMDMGDAGIYQLFGRGGMPMGGIMNKPPEMPMGAWNHYVRVDDIESAVERVSANGGTVMHGPMDVPGGDRVAVCQDPQGAVFSLHFVAAPA